MRPPANAAVRTDLPDFEMRWVLDQRQPAGIGPRRRGLETDGRALPERFMRPVVVVFEAELIEAALLGAEGRLGRARGFAFEGPMHPLVPTILLGSTRLNQLRANAEPDPPDGEGGQAAEGIRRKRGPVIGEYPRPRSEEHTSELQSRRDLVCRL